MKIAVAVSGGMDSLCALIALREAGHDVVALHALFDPAKEGEAVPGLQKVCAELDIPLHVEDLRPAFRREVMDAFIAEHRQARTPNPCARCNRTMKFGALLDAALRPVCMGGVGADAMSTGHYAALKDHPVYGPTLCTGDDDTREQSYFLALVPVERLRRCLFPLAHLHKKELREELVKRGIAVPLPKESREICFVPDDDYRAFLTRSGVKLSGAGPVLLRAADATEKVIARHKGLWNYTEGQRKGLGIPWSEPLYVVGRDPVRNALIVCTHDALDARSCTADEVNCMVPPELWPDKLYARIRYRQKPALAQVDIDGSRMHILFEDPQQPPAPGQVAAIYDADGFVLAGGLITAPESRG